MDEKRRCFGRAAGHFAAAAVLLLAAGYLWIDRDLLVDDTLFSAEIAVAAKRHALDADFVRAVIFQESRFDPFKKGRKGEYGLMQILPEGSVREWAASRGTRVPAGSELFDVRTNLEIGCWYLARGLREYRNYRCARELALIWYNAGPSRAAAWKPGSRDADVMPNIRVGTTKKYVTRVMARYRKYREKRKANP